MAQYKTGTVDATNGSNVVLGNGTSWLAEIGTGDLFTIPGDGVDYIISGVVSDQELTLSAPYAGTTKTQAVYTVSRDFTTQLGLPYISHGDIETDTLIRRAFSILDNSIDPGGSYILGPVSSVFGRIGTVIATAGDYGAYQVTFTPAGGLLSTDTQAAIVEVQGNLDTHEAVVAGNPHGVTQAEVGLGNADNTSDINKPVSTATQAALNLKEDLANKNLANGYAGLDASGLILSNQLPAIAITDTYPVASEAEMLALTVQIGDVAVRSDENKSYILRGADPAVLANWELLRTPTDLVLSVFGRAGVVAAAHGDYDASQIVFTPGGNLISTDVQAALIELDGDLAGHVQATGNVHSVSAAQIPNTPAGKLVATTVQGAIDELDAETRRLEILTWMGI